MTIRGVLFDKDGTLIDVNGTWVPIYRQMLCEQFDIKPADADLMMARVGYNPNTDGFDANSILAAGTTRQLIDCWWPGLDEAGTLEKVRMVDVDYAPLSKSLLRPLMPLLPLLQELKEMGLHVGLATNDSHYSACSHLNHLGVFDAVRRGDCRRYRVHSQALGRHDPPIRRHGRGETFRDCHGGRQRP